MPELSKGLQEEIAELEARIAEKKAAMKEGASAETALSEREIVREVTREKIAATPPAGGGGVAGAVPPPPSSGAATTPSPPAGGLPSYFSDEFRPKIQEFAKVALEKSLGSAIALAKASNNAALIDAFHDYIVDELYEKLVAEAKLREMK